MRVTSRSGVPSRFVTSITNGAAASPREDATATPQSRKQQTFPKTSCPAKTS